MGFAAAVSGFMVILFGSFYVLVVGIGDRASGAEYALFIDAGSMGSRIHLYKWLPEDDDRLPVITEIALDRDCNKVNHRLSELDGNVDTRETPIIDREPLILQVRESLKLLITCAQLGLTDRAADFQKIPLYLRATAGLRIARGKDKDRYYKIMEEVLAYLRSTPFHFGGARVIEGQEEALYAWIAANYLNGTLGKASEDGTIGILELGGASAQIAFAPKNQNSEETEPVQIGGRIHRVYMRGYDGVGKSKFLAEFDRSNTCHPTKYGTDADQNGTDLYKVCQTEIRDHLSNVKENVEPPKDTSLPDYDRQYLVLSNFYHTPKFFKKFFKDENLEFSKLLEDYGPEYCGKSWQDIPEKYKIEPGEEFLSEYCFMAAYIPILLTEFFGVNSIEGRVKLRLDPDGGKEKEEVDWTLGALICLLYDCRSES